jgi:hypothetical protein
MAMEICSPKEAQSLLLVPLERQAEHKKYLETEEHGSTFI